MSSTKHTLAKLTGLEYTDPRLPAISIFEDTTCSVPIYYGVNIARLHILARLEFFVDDKISDRDSYRLNLFIPVAEKPENEGLGEGKLVEFRQIQEQLEIRTTGGFQANCPTIRLQIQGPREIPLLVHPGQSSDDRGILDRACVDEQPYQKNPGIDFVPSESALYNLHAQVMTTRTQLVSWDSFAREGSCNISISSELHQDYSFRVDTIRSPNRRLDSQLRMAYSRDPTVKTKPIGF